jgi:hypothetical protein
MKTYGILGILWLVVSCFSAYCVIDTIILVFPAHPGPRLCFILGASLFLNLVAIVASLFLTRGDTWARWLLCVLAVFVAVSAVLQIVRSHAFPIVVAVYGLFGLVSAVVLFRTKRDDPA